MDRQRWEYTIQTLSIENEPTGGGWIAGLVDPLDELGEMGWDAVVILKQEEGYVHLLFKRPKVEEPVEPFFTSV